MVLQTRRYVVRRDEDEVTG